jgi:hypothetical protein
MPPPQPDGYEGIAYIALDAVPMVRSVITLELMRQPPKQDDATPAHCTD